MSKLRWAAAALAAIGVAGACARAGGGATLPLATTTSIQGSGLLDVLLERYKAASGVDVRAVAVGTGQALAILRRGDADVSLTHDPEAERAVLDSGAAQQYRKVMFNDFVIAGPAGDPADVRHAASAVEAMQRIAQSGAPFASRGDSSGTHTRELQLWNRAGQRPSGVALIETGQGQAPTLRVASERGAYVLTDRGTLSQLGPSLRLTILCQGGGDLINTYAVMIRTGLPSGRLRVAEAFAQWLADGNGRAAIDDFRIGGEPAFHAWPAGAPRDQPADLPGKQP
jgi:tungstate transport system substrate-binding protein